MLVCGGALPLVGALLGKSAGGAGGGVAAYVTEVVLALGALVYIGWLSATITHQARKVLAMQTAAVALPVLMLARFAGAACRDQLQL